jgi:hypothetical protein
MALTLDQLIVPLSQSQWISYLLNALQGVGPIIQYPASGVVQLQGSGFVEATGPAQAPGQVVVQITVSGNAYPLGSGTAAMFQFSVDNGLTFNGTNIPIAANNQYALPAIGALLEFVNGGYLGPVGTYFVAGESYQFTASIPTFPVTNWSPVGVGNSLVQIDAQALADLNLTISQAIAGGFTQSWINPPALGPPPDGWMDVLGQGVYDRDRLLASSTQGVVVLALASGGPYTFNPAELAFQSANGQVFYNTATAVLTSGTTPLSVPVQAQQPGSIYNSVVSYVIGAPPGTNNITNLLTTFPGVTVTNPLQSNPTVYHTGTGTGVMTAVAHSGAGPSGEFNVLVEILTATTYQYSLNGGATWTGPNTISGTAFTIPTTNMDIAFPSGSFVPNDIYAFGTSWITQRGTDTQSSLNYAIACQNQWASLAAAGPQGSYENWALAASSEVVSSFVQADPTTPGQVDVTLIGANNGPVSAGAIAAVQAYINNRAPLTTTVVVGTVSTIALPVTATWIRVQSQYLASAQNAISVALAKLADSIPPQGIVYLSVIEEVIQAVRGVIEITPNTLELNGVALDYQLAQNQVCTLTPPPGSSYQAV